VVAYLLEGARAERRGLVASLASAASEVGALLAVGVSALTVASMSEADFAGWGWRIPFFVGAALAGSVWIARSSMQESPEYERPVTAGSVPEAPGRLAVGVSALTVASMSAADLEAWGWRIPFLVGAALAGTVWVARSTMEESPEFHRQVAARTVPANPLRHSLTHHRGAIGRAFAISALGSITYYVGITYVPAFLTSAGGFSEGASLWLSTAAAVIVILVTPFVGLLSDRIGRKPVLAMLAAANIVLPITLFSLMAGGSLQSALLGALVLAALAGGVSAVGAVATAEQFPGEARVTGLALGATGATAIFGGLTPWLAQWLVERTGWAMAPGAMIALVGLAVLPLFVTMKETAPTR
jgi:MHS family proline/betaine transporter-like MFS transporter